MSLAASPLSFWALENDDEVINSNPDQGNKRRKTICNNGMDIDSTSEAPELLVEAVKYKPV
jgi:hypothetical protein